VTSAERLLTGLTNDRAINNRETILVAGDSLSMSRRREGIPNEFTYAAALQFRFPSMLVVNSSLRSNDSCIISSDEYMREHLFEKTPSYIIVQVGIVDCTPRIFARYQKRILSIMQRTPGMCLLSNYIITTASRHRYKLTRLISRSYIDKHSFHGNLRKFASHSLQENSSCRIIIVNIPCVSGSFVERNYAISSIVQRYNSVLHSLANEFSATIVDLYEYTRINPQLLLSDGYHIRLDAHKFLFQQLEQIIANP
jgi:lysophospholipase L1-like esterase